MAHRLPNGARINQWGHSIDSGATVTNEGGVVRSKGKRPSHKFMSMTSRGNNGQRKIAGGRSHTKHKGSDSEMEEQVYIPPPVANPGNVIQQKYTAEEVAELMREQSDVLDFLVGGGVMGDKICHENEAPYPESLCEFLIRSFCPPDGIVLDTFCGSGTTLKVALECGRQAMGMDVRESQVKLSRRRIKEIQPAIV